MEPPSGNLTSVGVVAIGRNEGERLHRCLRSLPLGRSPVVYVDSASSDGSVAFARGVGAEVIELDMSVPFTAARARNAGVERLCAIAPDVRYVLFLDGDCELVPGFLEAALAELERDERVAIVAGRRRELHPEASVYNRLCDLEWNTPVGEAEACGGDALVRREPFEAIGGYDPSLIAGEEPDMCRRIRARGYRVLRIDRDMTRHDAAMTQFSQWWLRNVRAGHAAAEAAHRDPESAFERRTVRSNLAWGLGLPLLSVGLAAPSLGTSLSLLSLYGVLYQRARRARVEGQGDAPREASLFAAYCVLGKLPQAAGVVRFHRNRLRGKKTGLIEYKGR